PGRHLRAEPGVFHRHHRRADAELQEAIDVLDLALVEPLAAVPAFDVARELRRELAGIEQRDRPRAVLAGDERRPRGLQVVADRRDEPDAGNYNATHWSLLPRRGPRVT